MNKSIEFLEKLSSLLKEYNVEIESNYEVFGYNGIQSYLDIDFQESPYISLRFDNVYFNYETFNKKAKELIGE